MKPFLIPLTVVLFFPGCAHLSNKGGVTMVGRGAALLHEHGDPVLATGQFTKEVSPDFAAGVAKAQTDDAWRNYWAIQDSAARGTGQGPQEAEVGKPIDYPVTIPEREDEHGVKHAPQHTVLTVNE